MILHQNTIETTYTETFTDCMNWLDANSVEGECYDFFTGGRWYVYCNGLVVIND